MTIPQAACEWAVKTAKDQRHGYSQAQDRRWGTPDYDCSSFALSSYKNGAGINIGKATYTGNMSRRKEYNKEWLTPGLS